MKYIVAILISLLSVNTPSASDRIYATGCIPSTPEDWERAGVPYVASGDSQAQSSRRGLGCGIVQDPNAINVPEALELKMSPVKRQGKLGACTTFTIAACIEYLLPSYLVSEAELLIRAVTKGKKDRSNVIGTPFHLYSPFIKHEGTVESAEFVSYEVFEQ